MKYQHPMFNQLIESDQVLCIGHRGGSFQGPENTVQIFKNKYDIQHMFELDVRLSKDGKMVVHHDAGFHRTCGDFREIQQTNYEDFPKLQRIIQPFGGSFQKIKVQTGSNQIPLLEQVFEKFPEKPMNIELKTPSDEAIQEYARIVKKYQREDITIWGVAGGKNQDLRNAAPSVVNFFSAGQILKIYILFLTGLLPFVCVRQGVIDIPLATQSFHKIVKSFTSGSCLKSCLGGFAFLLLNCFNFLGRLWIPHLKKRGILTFYFILNDQDDFDTAIASGCSGIMSDVPSKLNSYLKRRNIFFVEQTNSF